MNRFWIFASAIVLGLLGIFALSELLGLTARFDIQGWMTTPSAGVALLGVAVLAVDVVLPVPSSLVMIAHGALFGVVLGTLLSLAGSLLSALLGFWLGRRGGALVARLVPPDQRARADALLARWGMLAIIVTRPIPLLAEATSIVAGTSRMSYAQLLLPAAAGGLPVALLYALAGSVASGLDSALWSFGLALLVAGLFWLLRDPINRLLRNDHPLSMEEP
ncbi:MAG: hypothetical protein OHK0022_13430 [Roseiflexaceae bacterium]